MPHLDRYEDEGLDQEPDDYDEEAELEARLRAEAALDDRDEAQRGGRIDPATGRVRPRALEVDEDDDVWHRQQRRRRAADRDEDDEEEEEYEVDIETTKAPPRVDQQDRAKLGVDASSPGSCASIPRRTIRETWCTGNASGTCA